MPGKICQTAFRNGKTLSINPEIVQQISKCSILRIILFLSVCFFYWVHIEPQWFSPVFRTEKHCHIINSLIYPGGLISLINFIYYYLSAQVTSVKDIRSGRQKSLEKLAICFSFWTDVVIGMPPAWGNGKPELPAWSRCSVAVCVCMV